MTDIAHVLRLRESHPSTLTNSARTRANNKRLIELTLQQVEELRRKTSRVTRLWKDNSQIERSDLVALQERRRIRAEIERRREDESRQSEEIVVHSRAELDEMNKLCQTTQAAIHRYEQLCDEAVAEWERLDSKLESVMKERDRAAPRLEKFMAEVQTQSAAIEAEMQRLDQEIAFVEAENDALRYKIAENYERELF